MLSDLWLFRKVKESDIKAFETLFRRHYESLCRYAYGFVEDYDTSEEIIQDLFFRIWKDRGSIDILLSVKSYLYKSVRNHALLHLEHSRIRTIYRELACSQAEEEHASSSPLENLELKELEERIENILNHLPERRQQIFRMSRLEGKKYAEIAGELSLSVKTIEAEISKTLQELRKGLKQYI